MTTTKERQILFTGAMVRALLAGTKTQTRRIIKSPTGTFEINSTLDMKQCWLNVTDANEQAVRPLMCPYGQPGERLWVRENLFWSEHEDGWCYQADNDMLECEYSEAPILQKPLKSFIPSMHMPRVASRILLEIVAVRVERLQDISADDSVAEGVEVSHRDTSGMPWYKLPGWEKPINVSDAKIVYQHIWETINGADSWKANPWVWVVEFRKVQKGADNV
ncbi:hypothetical protein EU556_11165 [Hymenobacter fodinae]|uniref:Morphogenetic protein n=1 Tax=Hymenobacter fodinae TaxID=2510796 RepID=A0A4Z0P8Y6_9BACT|nr:hypothetical protein EU556_11165 [Hymenobacter fodinae]